MDKLIGKISCGEFTLVAKLRSNFEFRYLDPSKFSSFYGNQYIKHSAWKNQLCNSQKAYWEKIPVYDISKEEMAKHEGEDNAPIVFRELKDFLEKNNITSFENLMRNDNKNYEGTIEELKCSLETLKFPNDNNISKSQCKRLLDIIATLQHKNTLYGFYSRKKKAIYLCLDNMKEECQKEENSGILKLPMFFNSVLVHEYTHHIHISSMEENTARLKGVEKQKLDAVLETVAESAQAIFLEHNKWICEHSNGKNKSFPEWSYKGYSIMADFKQNEKDFEKLFSEIIERSKTNWEEAYTLISSIEKINSIFSNN